MNPHEQNYHAQEQELLEIVEALRHWRSYLHGQAFLDRQTMFLFNTSPPKTI
jgi:RNase H-like domain found in reverse transcriptase